MFNRDEYRAMFIERGETIAALRGQLAAASRPRSVVGACVLTACLASAVTFGATVLAFAPRDVPSVRMVADGGETWWERLWRDRVRPITIIRRIRTLSVV